MLNLPKGRSWALPVAEEAKRKPNEQRIAPQDASTETPGTRAFGVNLYEDRKTQTCYRYIFFVGENRFLFEKAPNQPWFQCMNIGLERPFTFKPGVEHTLRLIVDGTIATLYLDDVALNTRMYLKPGDSLGLFVTDGELTMRGASIARGLK